LTRSVVTSAIYNKREISGRILYDIGEALQ